MFEIQNQTVNVVQMEFPKNSKIVEKKIQETRYCRFANKMRVEV